MEEQSEKSASKRLKDLLFISALGVAEICHEANRVYCRLIGDNSQVPWDEAPDWQRESAIEGVEHALESGNRLKLGDPARDQHDNWMESKLRAGWKYGEIKDADAKTHPCLLPYNALPEEQKRKDVLFGRIVQAFIVRG